MVIYGNAEFRLDRQRLCRRLRIDGDTAADKNAREMLPLLAETAKKYTDLRTWYLIGEGCFQIGIPPVDACEKQVLCLCCASGPIAEMIARKMEEGEYLEGYLLDGVINDALFDASDRLNAEIAARMKAEGRRLTKKYVPGEGGMPLSLQKRFLELFRKETEISVKITESFMLVPEKTMLYAFGADENNPEIPLGHDCSSCPSANCPFRLPSLA